MQVEQQRRKAEGGEQERGPGAGAFHHPQDTSAPDTLLTPERLDEVYGVSA